MIDFERLLNPPIVKIGGKKYEHIAPFVYLEILPDGGRKVHLIRFKPQEVSNGKE